MDIAMKKDRPSKVSSRRSIKYRESSWRVHEFEVWSGERVCCCAVLRMPGSLLLWLGGAEPRLVEAALGMPAPAGSGARREAHATALLGAGAEAGAQQLARRLAAALARPVYVCCGSSFDRFSMPLVECGLLAEIKSWPEYKC